MLFYASLYIGELYKFSLPDSADDGEAEAEAARLGSRALFYSALISLFSNIFIPMLVAPASESGHEHEDEERNSAMGSKKHGLIQGWCMTMRTKRIHLATLWTVSHALFVVCMVATL